MNITVKKEKLDMVEQTRQSTKECEYMIIDGKAENLYDSEEVIEIEHLDKEETMDKETERQMMAKFHRKNRIINQTNGHPLVHQGWKRRS